MYFITNSSGINITFKFLKSIKFTKFNQFFLHRLYKKDVLINTILYYIPFKLLTSSLLFLNKEFWLWLVLKTKKMKILKWTKIMKILICKMSNQSIKIISKHSNTDSFIKSINLWGFPKKHHAKRLIYIYVKYLPTKTTGAIRSSLST